MAFEHDDRKPYEFIWFSVLLNIFPQQYLTLRPRGGWNQCREKGADSLTFSSFMRNRVSCFRLPCTPYVNSSHSCVFLVRATTLKSYLKFYWFCKSYSSNCLVLSFLLNDIIYQKSFSIVPLVNTITFCQPLLYK